MRRPVIAGNWKMYKTQAETRAFFGAFKPLVANTTHCEIVIAPPFTSLTVAVESARGSAISIAAQNCDWHAEGAFTGEISTRMIVDTGCRGVIIGHSERRQYFGETDESVNRKVKAALEEGLTPIVCIGESLAEREANLMQAVLKRQFEGGLAALTGAEFSRILLAYEPCWAIAQGARRRLKSRPTRIASSVNWQMPASRRNGLPRFGSSTVAASNPTIYGD